MKSRLLVLEGAKVIEIKEINKRVKDEAVRLVFDNGYQLEILHTAQGVILFEPNQRSQ